MKYLIRNFRPYKAAVLLIIVLLAGQAYCDMTLPTLTANIIDVGVQDSGIEHVLPEKITQEDYETTEMFMSKAEKRTFEAAYEKDGDIYKIKSDADMDELDDEMLEPIVTVYLAKRIMKKAASGNSEALASMSKYSSQAATASTGSMSQAAKAQAIQANLGAIKDKVKKMIDNTGSDTVESMAIKYATACDKRAGVDVDKIQHDYLWSQGIKMFIMAAVMLIFASVVGFVASRVGASIGRNLRSQVFGNVMSYSAAEMEKFQTSSLITRATNDIQQVQQVSIMLLRMVLLAPVMAVWGIIKVYQTHAHMNFVIIGSILVLLSFMLLLMSIAMPKFRIMQKLVDALNGVSREMLTGLPVIRAFGREKLAEERFDGANMDLRNTQLFVNRVMTFMGPMTNMVMYGTTVLITWVAAHRINNGTLEVGAMTAFITYAIMVIMSFLILTIMSVILPRAGVAAERINEVVTTKTSITNADDATELTDCQGNVEFRHVSFKYPDADDYVIDDISFKANRGETVAIIGSTGSGKSSLVNLLPRFYDVSEGSILIDGKDIREYTLSSLRHNIGYVPQKGVLFSGTIESNIKFGATDLTDEEVARIAKISQAADFIEEKDEKYESFIAQGGSNVSGGQKQRLSIARAIAKNPAVLIFDDSFSALDMKTDAKLRKALSESCADMTRITVAQRVGTILHADRIIVMDEGKIVGVGKYEDLMKSCDVYRQIADSQLSQKEIEEVM